MTLTNKTRNLIEKIERIDPTFGHAFWRVNIGRTGFDMKEFLKASPWGLFTLELEHHYGKGSITETNLKSVAIQKILLEKEKEWSIGMMQKNQAYCLELLKIRKTTRINYEYTYQPLTRLIMKLAAYDNDKRIEWIQALIKLGKVAKHLEKDPKKAKINFQEFNQDFINRKQADIFWKKMVIKEGRGPKKTLHMNKHFYQKVYVKIEKWLEPENLEVYKEWERYYRPKMK